MGPAGAGVLERLGCLTGLTDLDLSRNYFAAPVLNPRPEAQFTTPVLPVLNPESQSWQGRGVARVARRGDPGGVAGR